MAVVVRFHSVHITFYLITATGKFSPSKIKPPTEGFIRATGPKHVHAERTLYFVPPKDYHSPRKSSKSDGETGSSTNSKSVLRVNSLEFSDRASRLSGNTAKYHSHADSIGRSDLSPKRLQHQKSVEIPILPMYVLDGNNLPPTVAS